MSITFEVNPLYGVIAVYSGNARQGNELTAVTPELLHALAAIAEGCGAKVAASELKYAGDERATSAIAMHPGAVPFAPKFTPGKEIPASTPAGVAPSGFTIQNSGKGVSNSDQLPKGSDGDLLGSDDRIVAGQVTYDQTKRPSPELSSQVARYFGVDDPCD